MDAKRFLIVNADDFGQSAGINRGIAEAHENGIVTSASLMVRGGAAADGARYARGHPALSLGLHLDLGEWAFNDGEWLQRYEVVSLQDGRAVSEEVESQVEAFIRIVGREPTHIDSHQHVHRREPCLSIVVQLAKELSVSVRHFTPGVRYRGEFYGQTAEGAPRPEAITPAALIDILGELGEGYTELGCHPGRGNDVLTTYLREREVEVETLCDPQVRRTIQTRGIELRSHNEVEVTAPR